MAWVYRDGSCDCCRGGVWIRGGVKCPMGNNSRTRLVCDACRYRCNQQPGKRCKLTLPVEA